MGRFCSLLHSHHGEAAFKGPGRPERGAYRKDAAVVAREIVQQLSPVSAGSPGRCRDTVETTAGG
jgi:hypothetical protein